MFLCLHIQVSNCIVYVKIGVTVTTMQALILAVVALTNSALECLKLCLSRGMNR